MMKRVLTLVLALLLGSSFWQAGAVQPRAWSLGIQAGVAHSSCMASLGETLSPSVMLAATREFLPWLGLRASVSGYRSCGSVAVDQWKNALFHFYYVQPGADCVFDFAGMGSSGKDCAVHPYALVGLGLNFRFDNSEALAYKTLCGPTYWDRTTLALVGRIGVGMDVHLTKKCLFSLEVADNLLPDAYNSVRDAAFLGLDHNLYLSLGVKIRLK